MSGSRLRLELPSKILDVVSEPSRYKVLYGGRGCVDGDTLIDTPNGHIAVRDFKGGIIYAYNGHRVIETFAYPPIKYAPEQLFNYESPNGSFEATANHRILTSHGWQKMCHLSSLGESVRPSVVSRDLYPSYYAPSQLSFGEDALHLIRKLVGFLCYYSECHHLCGEQPQSEEDTYQGALRRLSCAHSHSHLTCSSDGLASEDRYILSVLFDLLSKLDSLHRRMEGNSSYREICSGDIFFELFLGLRPTLQQLHESKDLVALIRKLSEQVLAFCNHSYQDENSQKVRELLQSCVDDSSYSDSFMCESVGGSITSTATEKKEFYDLFVPLYNNYICGNGFIHHNSGKSWAVARTLLALGTFRKMRILCARETQKSIADSVHKLLKDQIYALGLEYHYEILQASIRGKNGTEFLFSGLRDAASLKSYEAIDICWIEEAQAVTENSWQLLIPTIRAANSEIWVVFNPLFENDPTYIRFVLETPNDCRIAKVNYTDNPWFPEVLRDEMEADKQKNFNRYLHVWEGECVIAPEGAVYSLDWFKRYSSLPVVPDRQRIIHSWDTAYKAGTHNDPSCCLVFHATQTLHYLADVQHGKWEYPELRKRAFELADRDKPDAILVEDKASGQSLIQEMRAAGLPVIPMKADADKETRARTTAAMVEAGLVFLPEYAPWLQRFETEIALFPSDSDMIHDDQVDALSQYLRYNKERANPNEFNSLLDKLGY